MLSSVLSSSLLSFLDLTTVLLFLFIFLITSWYFQLFRPANFPPGPRGWPILGCTTALASDKMYKHLYEWQTQYGDVMSIPTLNGYLVVMGTPELVQSTFVRRADLFSDRPPTRGVQTEMENKYGHGVVFSSGQLSRDLRKFALTALRDFGLGKKSLEERVNEEAGFVIGEMVKADGKPKNWYYTIQNAVSNIICSIVFGNRFEYDDKKFKRLLAIMQEQFSIRFTEIPENIFTFVFKIIPFHSRQYKKIMASHDDYHKFITEELREHERSFDEHNVRDFIDLYIKYRQDTGSTGTQRISESNVYRIVVDLFLAGTDTTSSTMMWAILYMMHYPEVQAKVQEEIDEVLGRSKMATMDDRAKMPYTEATIMEVQRISNIAPFTLMHVAGDTAMIGGYTVPKGTVVIANIFHIHMNKKVWTNPEVLKPERWLRREEATGAWKVEKHANFLPFSAGRRVCLGEQLARTELFLFLTAILQKFSFKPPASGKPPLTGYFGITLSPDAFEAIAVPRNL